MNGMMQLITTMPIYMHTGRRKTHFETLLAKQFFFHKEVDEFLKRK